MRIIAFDPGLRSLGVAVLDKDVYLATSKVPAKVPRPEAYGIQGDAVLRAVQRFKPDRICMEGPAYGAGGGRFNMEQLAVVRGLIEMVAWEYRQFEVIRVAPSAVKKHATGSGRATKAEVFSAMCDLAAARNWTLPANEDEADALALLLVTVGGAVNHD